MTPDLTGLTTFLAVAELKSFHAAAKRLGISRPAVSQAVRRLEDRVGVLLVQRSTRSVSLTEDGAALFSRVAPAIADVGAALAATSERDAAPRGLLRLAVSSIAERFLSGPLLADFARIYPRIEIEVTVTDEELDIVAHGYDAGVRLGEVIEPNMVAVSVSGAQRQVVVGAPSYVAAHGKPRHPRDLALHRCIGWRPAPGLIPYRWEFEENGRAFDVDVRPYFTTNDMALMIKTAIAGGGLTFGMEESFREPLESGALVTMLERHSPRFPGFYLYFPDRRNLAPKLRALIDHTRYSAKRK